jgi:hypothetical protein
MKKISLKVLTFMAVLTTVGLVGAATDDNQTTLNQIAGYRQWTRVNREPVQVVTPAISIDVLAAPAI